MNYGDKKKKLSCPQSERRSKVAVKTMKLCHKIKEELVLVYKERKFLC